MGVTYMTEEGYNKILSEINYLESVKRPEISAQIAEARDKGDLSENAEYDAAKEAQGILEGKIAQLKGLISNARLIDEAQIKTDVVQMSGPGTGARGGAVGTSPVRTSAAPGAGARGNGPWRRAPLTGIPDESRRTVDVGGPRVP